MMREKKGQAGVRSEGRKGPIPGVMGERHLILGDFAVVKIELFRNRCIILMKGQVTDSSVANFVHKAFQIINGNEHGRVVQWLSNGKEFAIKDIDEFEEVILPKYFRHRNINSFIRQLNMYGFHKSRKEPARNIFSHPYFQRDRRDLLASVKRKIKSNQVQTPKKPTPIEKNEVLASIADKPTAQKEENPSSSTSIQMKSCLYVDMEIQSPLKGMIGKSLIMDMNSEVCLRLRDIGSEWENIENEEDDEDKLSIIDEIEDERNRFNNRTRGISIVRTSNFLEDFEF